MKVNTTKKPVMKTPAIKHDLVEKEFLHWLEKVYGDGASENQVIEMRKAFFCGGFVFINKICQFGDLPAEIAETKFDNILAEIEERVRGWATDGTN